MSSAGSEIEVLVPDIGDFEDVEVVEVLVAAGDRVAVEDPLVSIESDKATMEIPSPHEGVVAKLSVRVGDLVSEGSPLLTLELTASAPAPEAGGASAAPAASLTEEARPASDPVPQSASTPASGSVPAAPAPVVAPPRRPGDPPPSSPPLESESVPRRGTPHASPLIRKLARELGVDLGGVPEGSGPQGRILREDLQSHVRTALAGGAASPSLGVQHDEADVTDLEAFLALHRESADGKAGDQDLQLGMGSILAKACAQTLRLHPEIGSPGDALGVAVETASGLVVVSLRGAANAGLRELAAELARLEARARDTRAADSEGALDASDLDQGGFALVHLGERGGTHAVSTLPSRLAVLSSGRIATRAVWAEENLGAASEAGFVPRRMLSFSLAYDPRALDAAAAARFTTQLRQRLEAIEHLLL